MSVTENFSVRIQRLWLTALALLFLAALWLRWPEPGPGWIHIDERVFLIEPLKLWSGDFNPHFFVYPTLHIYLAAALYYLYYLCSSDLSLAQFVAYHFFVDGAALLDLCRSFNTVLSAVTAVVIALTGARLYGFGIGLTAGLFYTVLPLSVRFAHLATTDTPALLWIAFSLYFAVRLAERGRLSDAIFAGACVGLAGATKYPAALAGIPVATACLLYRPELRQGGLWAAAATAAGVFALTSPYFFLDIKAAWADLTLMGTVHFASVEAKAEMSSWRYYLQVALRHGSGGIGLAALAVGVAWRPFVRRRAEWVVVALFAVFFPLLLMAESAFMRYALPLAPAVALLWARLMVGRCWQMALFLAVALGVEPLYASLQTRRLMTGDDTREQVERRLQLEAPSGVWLKHLPNFAGKISVLDADRIYSHQRRFLQSYDLKDLRRAYFELSMRRDLPLLYVTPDVSALASDVDSEVVDTVYVLWYQDPVIDAITADDEALLARCAWSADYRAVRAGAVYEAVDWMFLPIGGFSGVQRTGPHIRLGKVPLTEEAERINAAHFFRLLHDLLLGAERVRDGDWQKAIDLYSAIGGVPLPLQWVLSEDYYYTYLFNYGVALERMGRWPAAEKQWRRALALRDNNSVLYQNLGVAYARQGRLGPAREHLERALALDPDYAEAHFNLANLYYGAGELDAAKSAFARALQADPTLAGAWQGLGNIHFNRGVWEQALAAYREALALDAYLADAAFNKAKVHLRTGAPDAARAALEIALSAVPEDVEALYMLGDLHRQQGRRDEARMVYARAILLDPETERAAEARRFVEGHL